MELLEKQLKIKRSVIPRGGKGLFTTKLIPRGSKIIEYKGRITNWKRAENKKSDNKYLFYVNRDYVIDAKPYKKSLARYANDARGLKKIKGIGNNAEYVRQGLKIFIRAKKDIPANSEILVGYGKEYWDTIKHNNKLTKK